jgi:hypothetical protein
VAFCFALLECNLVAKVTNVLDEWTGQDTHSSTPKQHGLIMAGLMDIAYEICNRTVLAL